jgi:hypothetical protein
MSNAVKVEVPLPVEIPPSVLRDLTGAKVLGIRDVTEEEEYINRYSLGGGCVLVLELNTGDRLEVFYPFLTPDPDPAFLVRLDEAPAAAQELDTLVMSHFRATPRTLSLANVKQVLAHFKVARFANFTHEQALEGKAMVEKMLEASEAE